MILLKIPKRIIKKELKNIQETLTNCKGEYDRQVLKTEVPDNKWKYLTKKAENPYE